MVRALSCGARLSVQYPSHQILFFSTWAFGGSKLNEASHDKLGYLASISRKKKF